MIDTLGIEVVKELAGKPEATEGEVRQLVRQAIANWKRRSEFGWSGGRREGFFVL